jgi:VanZ family protein
VSETGAEGDRLDKADSVTRRARTILTRALLAALLAYWAFMVAMTHAPKPPPVGPRINNKLAHFLAYGLLTGLLFLSVWGLRPRLRRMPAWVLGIACAYAALDELTQPLSGRFCEMGDWLADAGGALVAVVCLAAFRAVYQRIRFGRSAASQDRCAASIPLASPLP